MSQKRKKQHFLSIKKVSVHQCTCDLPTLSHMFVVGFIFVVVFDIFSLELNKFKKYIQLLRGENTIDHCFYMLVTSCIKQIFLTFLN